MFSQESILFHIGLRLLFRFVATLSCISKFKSLKREDSFRQFTRAKMIQCRVKSFPINRH